MTRQVDGGITQLKSGLRLAPPPPIDADPLRVARHYLDYYASDFSRARDVVKRRANWVVVLGATVTGTIALVGTVIALAKAPWLGLVSTGLAGLVGVLAAWDGLFRHRDLWVQRSWVVSQLQELQREIDFREALRDEPDIIGRDCMTQLNEILHNDMVTWSELRNVHRQGSLTEKTAPNVVTGSTQA